MAKKKKAAGKPAAKNSGKKKPTKGKKAPRKKRQIESIEGDGDERHPTEPKANKQGLFDQGIEEFPIVVSETQYAKIEVVQATSGKWISSFSFLDSGVGFSRSLDVDGAEWGTRLEALDAACGELIGRLNRRKNDDLRNKVKDFQAALERDPAPVESNVEVVNVARDGQATTAPAVDPHDAELLDEIEQLELLCAEAEAEMIGAKEAAKEAKKTYEARCIDLRKKIRERRMDANRPLFSQTKSENPSRADEIAGREATTPVDTPLSEAGNQMDWQKIVTSDLHLFDVVPRMKKELAEQIEADYPTMGKLVDLHLQGTGKGQGIRSIKGVGQKMADAIIEILDNWLANVRDQWGKPAEDHQDFTGDNAPADLEPDDAGIPDAPAETPEDQVPYDDSDDETIDAEFVVVDGPSDADIKHWWSELSVGELHISKSIVRKLARAGLIKVGDVEVFVESGKALLDIPGLYEGEVVILSDELVNGQVAHEAIMRLKHELLSGQRTITIDLEKEEEAYYFHDGYNAAGEEGLQLFHEVGSLGIVSIERWMAGYVKGLQEKAQGDAAADAA